LKLLKEERARAMTTAAAAAVASSLEIAASSSATVSAPKQSHAEDEEPILLRTDLKELVAGSLFYCDNAIDDEAAARIERVLDRASDSFTQLSSRRVAVFGKHPGGDDGSALLGWLESLSVALVDGGVFSQTTKPNNCLVNAYPSRGGIMHHTDGPLYESVVAVVSLGGPVKLTFRPRLAADEIGIRDGSDVVTVMVMPNSLLVFRDDMYTKHLHGVEVGINVEKVDDLVANRLVSGLELGSEISRGARVSLTLRRVVE